MYVLHKLGLAEGWESNSDSLGGIWPSAVPLTERVPRHPGNTPATFRKGSSTRRLDALQL